MATPNHGHGFEYFMCKKDFHPKNWRNLLAVYEARQKETAKEKREVEMRAEYAREQAHLEDRKLLGDHKARVGLAFMYDAPSGLMKKKKEAEDEERLGAEELERLEKEAHKKPQFEWQKKWEAPREEWAKDRDDVRDKPLGFHVRYVKCIRCKQWGHESVDVVCPLYNRSALDGASTNPSDIIKAAKAEREGKAAPKQSKTWAAAPDEETHFGPSAPIHFDQPPYEPGPSTSFKAEEWEEKATSSSATSSQPGPSSSQPGPSKAAPEEEEEVKEEPSEEDPEVREMEMRIRMLDRLMRKEQEAKAKLEEPSAMPPPPKPPKRERLKRERSVSPPLLQTADEEEPEPKRMNYYELQNDMAKEHRLKLKSGALQELCVTRTIERMDAAPKLDPLEELMSGRVKLERGAELTQTLTAGLLSGLGPRQEAKLRRLVAKKAKAIIKEEL